MNSSVGVVGPDDEAVDGPEGPRDMLGVGAEEAESEEKENKR